MQMEMGQRRMRPQPTGEWVEWKEKVRREPCG